MVFLHHAPIVQPRDALMDSVWVRTNVLVRPGMEVQIAPPQSVTLYWPLIPQFALDMATVLHQILVFVNLVTMDPHARISLASKFLLQAQQFAPVEVTVPHLIHAPVLQAGLASIARAQFVIQRLPVIHWSAVGKVTVLHQIIAHVRLVTRILIARLEMYPLHIALVTPVHQHILVQAMVNARQQILVLVVLGGTILLAKHQAALEYLLQAQVFAVEKEFVLQWIHANVLVDSKVKLAHLLNVIV